MKKEPPIVYKYRTFENASHLGILISNEIYLPSPLQLNDPFDCSIPFTYWNSTDIDKIKKYLKMTLPLYMDDAPPEMMEKSEDEIIDWILSRRPLTRADEIKDEIQTVKKSAKKKGIFSVVSDNESTGECGNANHLMWSHYSNGHTGFCIEFDKEKLLLSLAGSEEKRKGLFFDPVSYMKKLPIITPYKTKRVLRISKNEILKILLTKHIKWRYENEWRVIGSLSYPNAKRTAPIMPDAIKAIYLGLSVTDENVELMKNILRCHPSRPKLFLAEHKDGSYEIQFQELTY